MFAQGMFQIDPNATPDQVERKRAMIAALMPRFGQAKYVGEGLGQLATGIAMGSQNRKLDRAENAGRQGASDLFSRIMGGARGDTSGFSILGQGQQAPQPAVQYDPNSPQSIASDTMAALGKDAKFTPGDRDSFVNAMMPHALRVSQQTGLDPRLVIAQAAQETGWGKSAPNNNFFGIKSHGKGGANLGTFEFVNGQRVNVNDSFRTYGGMGQSADDYARFLQENPRYKNMLAAGDLDGQLAALGASGYATDPNYSASVGSIAKSIQLPGGQPQPQGGVAQNLSQYAQPVQASADEAAIYEALANPWLNAQQRAALTDMLIQLRQNADPMRRLEMQKLQKEVELMGQPKAPTPTDDMREYMFAKQQGFKGTFTDFMTAMRKAGASTTNINNTTGGEVGTIPQGFELFTDAETGARSMRPIAGGPEDQTQKNEKAAGGRDIATQTITSSASRAREASKNRSVDGFLAGIAAMNPESENAEIYRQVDVLKSQAIVSNLQAMRDASPTGGALGAVTAPELKMLADKSGALDPRSKNFERDLNDYELSLLQVVHGPDEGRRIFEATRSDAPTAPDEDGWQTINGYKVRVKQ